MQIIYLECYVSVFASQIKDLNALRINTDPSYCTNSAVQTVVAFFVQPSLYMDSAS